MAMKKKIDGVDTFISRAALRSQPTLPVLLVDSLRVRTHGMITISEKTSHHQPIQMQAKARIMEA